MAKSNPNIYITDFKAGLNDKNESIKWSYKQLLKEKQLFIQYQCVDPYALNSYSFFIKWNLYRNNRSIFFTVGKFQNV